MVECSVHSLDIKIILFLFHQRTKFIAYPSKTVQHIYVTEERTKNVIIYPLNGSSH